MTHTNACGTEPFDKVYCLGYQVHHEDWSPFPRVNRLRQDFLDRPYDIDVERLRLVTEAYKEHPTAPRKLQCAYAFKKVLENTTLYVYDEDLILGEIAAPAKASPIYPEFSVAVIKGCAQKGLMIEGAGTYGNVIRFLAPLVMTDEQLEAGFDIYESVIKELLEK